jgi:hypothetical protein
MVSQRFSRSDFNYSALAWTALPGSRVLCHSATVAE